MADHDILFTHDIVYSDTYTPHSASGIYKVLFDMNNRALQTNVSPFVFATFTGPTQTNFAIALTEHPNRTKHYENKILASGFVIPDNGYGEYYTEETWCKEVSGGVFSRSVDKLISSRRIYRLGGENAQSVMSARQETLVANKSACQIYEQPKSSSSPGTWGEYFSQLTDEFVEAFDENMLTGPSVSGSMKWGINTLLTNVLRIPLEPAGVRYECRFGAGWDNINGLLNIQCCIIKDGELITNPTSANVTISNDSNTEVVNTDMGAPLARGVFYKTLAAITLNPDRMYWAEVSIVVNGVTHKSPAAAVTWD